MRHSYVQATTSRYIEWVQSHIAEHGDPPSLNTILRWMQTEEQYYKPFDHLRNLLCHLRARNQLQMVCWIALELHTQVREDDQFIEKVGDFFDACARRFKVDDFDVQLHASHKKTETLYEHHNPK